MNSSSDKQPDRRLDQLLSQSVGADAAPMVFSTAQLPSRPQFAWVIGGSIAAVMLLLVVLGAVIALNWNPDLSGGSYALSDGIYAASEYLTSQAFLLYAGAAMAVVYAWFARKLIRLYRYY